MPKKKKVETHEIEIKGPARIYNIDKSGVTIALENAEDGGILSLARMTLKRNLIPADFEYDNYEIRGKYSLTLTLKKK